LSTFGASLLLILTPDRYGEFVAVMAALLGLLTLILAVLRIRRQRAAERAARQKHDTNVAIEHRRQQYEKEAEEVLKSLGQKSTTQSQQELTRLREEQQRVELRREELKRVLSKHHSSLEQIKRSEQAPDAIGFAIADIQQQITETQSEISALPKAAANDSGAASEKVLLDEAISRHPDIPYLYLKRAAISITDRARYQQLVADCNRALQLCPIAWGFLLRGAAHEFNENISDASDDYLRALDLYPQYETALCNLSSIYNGQGKHLRAMELAERALRLHPHSAYAHEQIAIAFSGIKDIEKAVYHYSQCLDQQPSWAVQIRLTRARLLHQLGRDELALHDAQMVLREGLTTRELYDLLIELQPNNPAHYVARARRHYYPEKDLYDKVSTIADLRRAILLYRNTCQHSHLCCDDAEDFIDQIQKLKKELGDECRGTAESDELLASYRTALPFVMQGESESRATALREAAYFAMDLRHYDQAIAWAHESLSAAAIVTSESNESCSSRRGSTERAYICLAHTYAAAERGSQAIDYLVEAISLGDSQYRALNEIELILGNLREKQDFDQITACIDRLVDKMFTRDSNPNDPRHRLILCFRLATLHATWRDTPLFDLQTACEYAERAYSIAKQKSYGAICDAETSGSSFQSVENAAAFYCAICESIRSGSGHEAIAKDFADPIAYHRVVTQAKMSAEHLTRETVARP
jgi:hypothetical protein